MLIYYQTKIIIPCQRDAENNIITITITILQTKQNQREGTHGQGEIKSIILPSYCMQQQQLISLPQHTPLTKHTSKIYVNGNNKKLTFYTSAGTGIHKNLRLMTTGRKERKERNRSKDSKHSTSIYLSTLVTQR